MDGGTFFYDRRLACGRKEEAKLERKYQKVKGKSFLETYVPLGFHNPTDFVLKKRN